jgi:hypothetical protein
MARSRREKDKYDGLNILILGRGDVEFGIPKDWTAEMDTSGQFAFMKLKDPGDNCLLEASYLILPPLLPTAPGVAERLRWVLPKDTAPPETTPILSYKRGRTDIAWVDYSYEEDDTERGERRVAHARWLIASNEIFQALLTFYYWADDASWTVPIWGRAIETLRLGDGTRLKSPWDHWSLRRD